MVMIADSGAVNFRKYCIYSNNAAYNPKYDVAFLDDELIKNENGLYLSRISKKNGKHRYYITNEGQSFTCNGCGEEGCCSRYCRGGLEYSYYYKSKYVGKDIEVALLQLGVSSN